MKYKNNTKGRHKPVPLRHFTWEKDSQKTDAQALVEATVMEWYEAKHRTTSKEEVAFINSIPVTCCPFCGSTNFVKAGHDSSGIQRFKCVDCKHRFNPFTNTIFDEKKIAISEWIEYLLHLFEFHSIFTSAFDNRNAASTGKYWLIKVFQILKGIQDDVVLSDTVWLDETYLPVIKSKTIAKDGKKLRGVSRNKICICCARDKHGKSLMIVTNTSKPSLKSTWASYGSHIAPESTLIHDGEHSHSVLIERLNLKSEVHTTDETKGLEGKDNPLYEVNRIHFFLKRFMREHGSYKREDLQDWMNLLWFILNDPSDKYDKVLKFFTLAVSSPMTVRYRSVMSKKSSK